jgi:uncharacterized Zn-finger protein
MADPAEKRLLDRINDDLKWRSKRFRLGRKTYEFEEMGALLANIRRRTGYRFKPVLAPADPTDSDITDHGESTSSSEDEDKDEADEDKDEADEDKNEADEDKNEADEDKNEADEDKDEMKSLTCEECDQRFSNDGNLRRHRKSIHRSSQYSCSKCSKRFSRSDNLKRHSSVCIDRR